MTNQMNALEAVCEAKKNPKFEISDGNGNWMDWEKILDELKHAKLGFLATNDFATRIRKTNLEKAVAEIMDGKGIERLNPNLEAWFSQLLSQFIKD